jgi:AsmA protein
MRRLVRPLLVLAIMVAAGLAGLVFAAEAIFARVLERRLEAETGFRWSVSGKPSLALRPEPAILIRDLDGRADLGAGGLARLEVATVRLLGSVSDLIATGHVGQIEFERPVAHLPAEWWRHTAASGAPRSGRAPGVWDGRAPDRVAIRDGSIRLIEAGAGQETTLAGIDVDAVASEGLWTIKGAARFAGEVVRCELKFGPSLSGREGAVPLAFKIEGAGLPAPVAGNAEAGADGALVTLSKLAGASGANRFTGAVVIDLRAKPFVRVDLGFPTLAIAARSGAPGTWRVDPELVRALRAFDGRFKLYAGSLQASPVSLSEVSGEARLADGVVTLELSRATLYGGEARGTATLNPSGTTLRHSLSARIEGVRGLPFLSDVAGFTMLDGVASASVELQGLGWGSNEIARTVSGSAELDVRAGKLNQVNLPSLARLMTAQLSGARPTDPEATAFDRVSARFEVKEGRASTADMTLRGPVVVATGAGSIDLLDRTLSFTVKPQLAEGGAGGKLAGLGVPVIIQGPWDAPRVVADLSGVTLPEAGIGGVIDGLLGDGGGGVGKLLESIIPGMSPAESGRPGARRPNERR